MSRLGKVNRYSFVIKSRYFKRLVLYFWVFKKRYILNFLRVGKIKKDEFCILFLVSLEVWNFF